MSSMFRSSPRRKVRLSYSAPWWSTWRNGLTLALVAAALLTALIALRSDSGAAEAQAAPTVTAVAISSSAGSDQTYALGQTIEVTLTFSEAVTVSGSPQLAIDMDPAEWGTKWAAYDSGSGGASIVFAHTVVEPNISTQGVAVLANTLKLNGGSITSASSSTAAALAHSGLAHDSNHRVNWRLSQSAPTVSSLAVTSDSGDDRTYVLGETIDITVTFSEAVDVTGAPNLKIDMDPAFWGEKTVSYSSGGGTARLTFAHTVVEPNLSTRGIAVLANSLTLNGGSITSSSSQANAGLSHSGLDHDADHRVDWRLSPAAEPVCEPVAPSSVSALTIGQGAVVSWTLPADLSDACEVTGFVVTAVNEAVNARAAHRITDPDSRSHTFSGLTPGDHVFSVSVTYADVPSGELTTSFSTNVPDSCITLAVQPYARNAVSGRISSINGTGCEERQTFDLEFRRSGYETWRRYSALPWSSIDTQTDPSRPHFIMYGIDPNVPHEFRITAYDASDNRYETDPQSVTITAHDPSETADANSPTGLHIVTNNNSGISIRWDAVTAPAGRTLTNINVQWKTCPRHSLPKGCTGDLNSATKDASDTDHEVEGLTNGTYYTARVAARTHASGQPAWTATDAWTVWAPAVRVFFEPVQIWFIDDTPNPNTQFGRTFMTSGSNKGDTSGWCSLNSSGGGAGEINCPPRTLVSLLTSGDRVFDLKVTGTIDDESVTIPSLEGPTLGAPPPQEVRASGGAAASDGNSGTHEGRIVIYSSVGPSGNAPGSIAGYQVQHRKQNANGTWPAWPTGATAWTDDSNPTERFRTISGLEDGTYQVRVRSRIDNTEDHDSNPNTPNQVVSRHSFTSEVVTVAVDASHTDTALPFPITVIPGHRKLTVEWALLDRGSIPIAYQVRHRRQGTSAWTESAVLAPRATTLICKGRFRCVNPRRYEIAGLIADFPYEVELRARNANGWTAWHTSVVRPGPRDITGPVPVSAVHTSGQKTVVITLDEAPNPNFVPAPGRFELLRRSVMGFERLGPATDVSLNGSRLTLTFENIPSTATHVVYLFTYAGPLQDLLGNKSEAFTVGFTRN